MALSRSIGARKDSATVGTTALDARKAYEGLVTGPGVLPGSSSPLVQGTAGWAYRVNAAWFVTKRASGDGVHLFANDGPVDVTTTAAPGTGSRIDVVWVRGRSAGENGDSTSAPEFGVTSSAASGSPVKPSIPTGALELATSTVAAGSSNTTFGTITQSAPRAYAGAGVEGAKVQIGHGAVPNAGSGQALGAAGSLLRESPGWSRATGGIVVPTAGVYTITVQQSISGAVFTARAFVDITLSSPPPSGGATSYRIPSYGENSIAGSVTVDLAAGTTVGLTGYQASGSSRQFDGHLTVLGSAALPVGW